MKQIFCVVVVLGLFGYQNVDANESKVFDKNQVILFCPNISGEQKFHGERILNSDGPCGTPAFVSPWAHFVWGDIAFALLKHDDSESYEVYRMQKLKSYYFEDYPLRPKKWRKMEVTAKFYTIEGWKINRETLKVTRLHKGEYCDFEYAQTMEFIGIHFTPRGLVCKFRYLD